jgi:hypothetical protein
VISGPAAPEPHPRLRELDVLEGAQQILRSMFFSNEGPGPLCSFALEYFWQIEGDDLRIWHGAKDSPARFRGTVDRTAGTIEGRWEWPGGGYQATETRLDEPG